MPPVYTLQHENTLLYEGHKAILAYSENNKRIQSEMRLLLILLGWMLCNNGTFAFAGDTNTDRLVKRSPKSLYSVERSDNQRRGIFDFLNANKNTNDKNDQLVTTGDARNNDLYVNQPNNPEALIIPAAGTDEAMNKQEATKGSPEVVTIDQVEKKREDNNSQTKAPFSNASEDKIISSAPANVKDGQHKNSAALNIENSKNKSDSTLDEDKNNAKLTFDSGSPSVGPALSGNKPDSAHPVNSDNNVHENQAGVPAANAVGREANDLSGSPLQQSHEYDYVYVNADSEVDADESQFYQQGYYDALRDFGMDNLGQGNSDVDKIPEAYRSTDENRPQVPQEYMEGTPLGVSQPVSQKTPQEDSRKPPLKEGPPEVPQSVIPQETSQRPPLQEGPPEVPQLPVPQAGVPQVGDLQAALQEASRLAHQNKKVEGSLGTLIDDGFNNSDFLDASILDRTQFEEAFVVAPALSADKSGVIASENNIRVNVSLIQSAGATNSTRANYTVTGNFTLNETTSSTTAESEEFSVLQHTLLQTDDDEIIDINTLDFSMGNRRPEAQVSSADSNENSNDLSQYKAVVLQSIGEEISRSEATFLSCANAKYFVLAIIIHRLINF